jgi:hypothetical protein
MPEIQDIKEMTIFNARVYPNRFMYVSKKTELFSVLMRILNDPVQEDTLFDPAGFLKRKTGKG